MKTKKNLLLGLVLGVMLFVSVTGIASATPSEEIVVLPVCGDGTINQAGEECDDGNLVSGDSCSATCQIEKCVLTVLNPLEGQWFDSQAVPIEWDFKCMLYTN